MEQSNNDRREDGQKARRPRIAREGARGQKVYRPQDQGRGGEFHSERTRRDDARQGWTPNGDGFYRRSDRDEGRFSSDERPRFDRYDFQDNERRPRTRKGGQVYSTRSNERPTRNDDERSHRRYNGGGQNHRPRRDEGAQADGFVRRDWNDGEHQRPNKKKYAPRERAAATNYQPRKFKPQAEVPATARPNPANKGLTRLNKYIANAGICSRREADKLIAAGAVMVNGVVVSELGYKVKPGDVVSYGGQTLKSEPKRYVLLNKPKGYITTVDDPQERQTVMQLVDNACSERIYPVGRLDRNTTGLLLFTNDGELSRKLTHPSTGVYKIYHVELNHPLTREDMRRMTEGIVLEDGPIAVDEVQYVGNGEDKRIVGVVLHSGRNRIVRRIFESMGYDIHKLDRVVFAGLTKKDLPRGRWRMLTEKEVGFLKML